VNLVSMLLATALGAGSHAAPATAAPPAPGPVTSAHVPSGPACCGTSGVAIGGGAVSDCGCSSKPGLFDRLRGMFARKGGSGCDSCAPAPVAQCAPAPVAHCAPKAAPSCGGGCAPTAGACDPCSGHGKASFLDRLRGGFRLGGKSHGGSSDCGCSGGAVIAPAPGGVIHSAPLAPAAPLPHAGAPLPHAPAYHGTPVPSGPVTAPPVEIKKLPADVKPVEPPKVIEQPKGKTLGAIPAKPEITPAGAKSETGVKSPFDSARRHDERLAHAADYSKLTGLLQYVHADGGLWVLRYASLAEEDANGGSVIIHRDGKMANYREGDLVTVEGEVTAKKGSSRLGAPLYQVRTINLVDRPSN